MVEESNQRKMFDIEVGVTQQDMIRIAQGDMEEQVIVLHPAQVEFVCKWILEVRDEILAGEHADDPAE